ncbi:carboxylating nicotinate-nucleotide diphosphorylase [Thermotoga sp. KOL6]|uniref:carboxylating nicotinate-nucleotide diphosphorylase n=1 Tax=Thermotoga sp. KOL6 TaxID=126741 RepID=UPI000C77FC11|nr:carboxylating nicotinate-nucleotide diphosphorylase [Thermotoga sp. KOL6]PLV60306.1 nicotinate-nucleotide pyrophosphorylase [Thermotoga sp. KOL6]
MDRLIRILMKQVEEDEGSIDLASFSLRGIKTEASIILKTENVVASGIEIIQQFTERQGIATIFFVKDGDFITRKGEIGKLSGDAYKILLTERTLLNTLALMFSTATVTRRFAQKLKHAKIAATRKVILGSSLFQKLSVIHGGGDSHRFNLSECVMLKDNHLKIYGSVEKAIRAIRKMVSFTKKIEVEVENLENALEAVEAGADIVMLDNLTPEEVRKISGEVKRKNPNVIIEVSGGITEENLTEYDLETVDLISTSRLTFGGVFVDLSLEIQR